MQSGKEGEGVCGSAVVVFLTNNKFMIADGESNTNAAGKLHMQLLTTTILVFSLFYDSVKFKVIHLKRNGGKLK